MTDERDDLPTAGVEPTEYAGLEIVPDTAPGAPSEVEAVELGAVPDVDTGSDVETVVMMEPQVGPEPEVAPEHVAPELNDAEPVPVAERENPLSAEATAASEPEKPLDRGVPEKPAPLRRLHMERPAQIAVASLALIAILFLFVFPTRAYLAQQRQVSDERKAVAVLKAENAELAREAGRLQTKGEIERMARVQFNMVFKGEQAYNVISPHRSASTTTTLP